MCKQLSDLVLSERHFWQNCDAVYQVLAFTSQENKNIFDAEFKTRVEKHDIEHASDCHESVFAKFRVAISSKGTWTLIIRNNLGQHLYEKETNITDKDKALDCLLDIINENFDHIVKEISKKQYNNDTINIELDND